jgi:hypothetical protein
MEGARRRIACPAGATAAGCKRDALRFLRRPPGIRKAPGRSDLVGSAGSAIGQSLALGALFVAIAATTDAGYVALAGSAAPALGRLGRGRGWVRTLNAATSFGLAGFALLYGGRQAKPG